MKPSAKLLFRKGRRLLESRQASEAVVCLAKAADRSPDHPEILKYLAEAYQQSGKYLPALQAYDRIIELKAATADTWRSTGNALTDVGEYAQAMGAYENSLKLDDTNPETHHNYARVCYRMGDVSRAARHLERSLELCDSIDSWQSLATLIPALPEADHCRIMETRQTFARKLATWYETSWPEEDDRPLPRRHEGPIRIGYVSAFFHNTNYTKPVWGLINHHDRSEFQISLFSDSPPKAGMPCYQTHAEDEIHDVRNLDNDQLAALVRSSKIDILVDLNAYSFESRLGLFLRHPAPVTVAWWAMYATSGLPGIDYLIGDNEMIKPGEEAFYTERLVRLPVSYFTFSVDYPVPPIVPPPCIERGFFTFGSLVPQYKITPQVMDAWCEILRRTKDSRLLLANHALKSRQNCACVLEQFRRRDVDAGRLTLLGPSEHFTYLRHYDNMDMALDAFPYNGGTTTIEAIWQGVPVLTFDGDRWISRTSQTMLRRSHLGSFVANDVSHMIERGTHWASHPDAPQRLAELRRNMREKLSVSSACDTAGLARAMERFYKQSTTK